MAIWRVIGLLLETHVMNVEVEAPTKNKAILKANKDWGITNISTVRKLEGRKKINPRYKR